MGKGSQQLKLAAIQMSTSASISQNMETIEKYLAICHQQNVDLAVLPEECLTLACTNAEKFKMAEPLGDGEMQRAFGALAKKYQLYLLVGTFPICSTARDKYYSTSLFYNPQGEQVAHYHKIHLFDVSVHGANERYMESASVEAGQELKTFSLNEQVCIGFSICYDIRFPDMYRLMALHGANLLCLPSAFTIPTGEKHWEVLVRARAIENLSYVVACNNSGTRHSGEGTYGHSMIVSPWGEILGALQAHEDLLIVECDFSLPADLRDSFPVLSHHKALKFNEYKG